MFSEPVQTMFTLINTPCPFLLLKECFCYCWLFLHSGYFLKQKKPKLDRERIKVQRINKLTKIQPTSTLFNNKNLNLMKLYILNER